MDDIENSFVRKYSTGTTSEMTFLEDFVIETEEQEMVISEEEDIEPLYAILFEEIDHFQRHTRYYIRKLGGLKVIPALPRRRAPKK